MNKHKADVEKEKGDGKCQEIGHRGGLLINSTRGPVDRVFLNAEMEHHKSNEDTCAHFLLFLDTSPLISSHLIQLGLLLAFKLTSSLKLTSHSTSFTPVTSVLV